MNSVSPSAIQYGSPERLRKRDDLSTLSKHHVQPNMGYQEATGEAEADEVDKLKSKLMTAWNNVKYGWTVKIKTTFSRSPLCLLGEQYQFRFEDNIKLFQKDFVSRIWLTYRRDFPALDGTTLTTDCGWGCMIRSAQMLLAHGLLVHLLGRDWLWPEALVTNMLDMETSPGMPKSSPASSSFSNPDHSCSSCSHRSQRRSALQPHQEQIHRDVLRWFSDHPGAPFALHRLVALGSSFGKKAGDWYGPSIVAHIMRKALDHTSQVPELSVYVSQDCTVYRKDVEQLLDAEDLPSDVCRKRKAVIILVPVRLGGETFNPVYKDCIKAFLQMASCLGIIGGKPKHSLYFIGYQDNNLLYLDPHYCQPYIDTSKDDFPLESFHCTSPRKISITRMDPSCTFAFYARNQSEFDTLCSHLKKVLNSPSSEEKYPIFSIIDGHAQAYSSEEGARISSLPITCRKKVGLSKRHSSDEFEFL